MFVSPGMAGNGRLQRDGGKWRGAKGKEVRMRRQCVVKGRQGGGKGWFVDI